MARSTGPILALGAVTVVNASVVHGQPIDWRVPIATGLLAGVFAVGEHAWADGVVGLAWLAFGAVMLSRVNPKVPSPTESFLAWWQAGQKG
jgi:hypothetical protein